MKLLYIGVYRDGTGYGHMAIDTMMSLITAGVDVTARPLKLNNAQAELPPQIIEAENKGTSQFDAVIQNVLPHDMEYCGKIPINVGYYCTETSRFDTTVWPEKINTMDRAWVCSGQNFDASRRSGVIVPIDIIPIGANIAKYQRSYKPLSIRDRFRDSFIFYYIGDFNKRKNIKALIQAFHLEFDTDEPVELVLKTRVNAIDKVEADKQRSIIINEIDKVKYSMNIYPSIDHYKKEILLTGDYSEEEIMRLHSSCDCFVSASYGEAWGIPAFDAMALGKTPITTRCDDIDNYGDDVIVGWQVSSTEVPVWGMNNTGFNGLYTSRESWYEPSIYHLMECMREAYTNTEERKRKSIAGRKRAYDFSYEKVGREMIKVLS